MQAPQQKKTSRWQLAGLVLIGTIFATWVLLPGESTQPGLVKAADFGDKWPLNAGEATLGCETFRRPYFVDSLGRRCGLNGSALGAGMSRCDDAYKRGNAVNGGDLREKAIEICESRGELM